MYKQEKKHNIGGKKNPHAKKNMYFMAQHFCRFFMTYVVNPIWVGFILYGREAEEECSKDDAEEWGVRVCIAWSLINTSNLFLGVMGALPGVGSYTNMISKVFLFQMRKQNMDQPNDNILYGMSI